MHTSAAHPRPAQGDAGAEFCRRWWWSSPNVKAWVEDFSANGTTRRLSRRSAWRPPPSWIRLESWFTARSTGARRTESAVWTRGLFSAFALAFRTRRLAGIVGAPGCCEFLSFCHLPATGPITQGRLQGTLAPMSRGWRTRSKPIMATRASPTCGISSPRSVNSRTGKWNTPFAGQPLTSLCKSIAPPNSGLDLLRARAKRGICFR